MANQQSEIYICSGVKLNSRYEHTYRFQNVFQQRGFFVSKAVKHFADYSYLRKNWDIKVNATMDEASSWDYLFFSNLQYTTDTKTYYYFINDIQYVNEGVVRLSLELDVIQTYMFDFELLPSFIERQHTATDEIGEHTVEEGLDVGELTVNEVFNFDTLTDFCILILSSVNLNTPALGGVIGSMFSNVFSGLAVYAVDATRYGELQNHLEGLASSGDYLNGIIAMWMYPRKMVVLHDEEHWTQENFILGLVKEVKSLTFEFDKPLDINGYTPKNNKVLCYPYNFAYVSNNNGGAAAYRYERFNSSNICKFICYGAVGANAGTRLIPLNYNNQNRADDNGLDLTGYPSCAWNADIYKMWLATHENQQSLSIAMSGLQIAGGVVAAGASVVTGNAIGAAGGIGTAVHGAAAIGQILAQRKDMSLQPPEARGTHAPNVNAGIRRHTFTAYQKQVTVEQAKIIDDYFTMYGYKINRVQVPNIFARPWYNYIKTIGCHIKSQLCNADAIQIESIFDHGITFWESNIDMCDYSIDNSP